MILTITGSVIASSGFWLYIQKNLDKKSATTQLLLGLAYNQIITLGVTYIERGYITKDEYEDFHKYLYVPYTSFGGNGLAERIMRDVGALPFKKHIV